MVARPLYRIVTSQLDPFMMYDNATNTWSGYCMDLLKEFQRVLDFDYELREPEDGRYGNFNTTTMKWNGMIGELIENKSDIALSAMWVTRGRRLAIDFTEPFYEINGISFVMKKESNEVDFFRFLTVLQWDVWLSFFGAFLLIVILLYLFERFSPFSYKNDRERHADQRDERFASIKECFWYLFLSIVGQSDVVTPKNLSGKLIVITWWIFAFIIVSAYTANLAAYLTLVRMEKHVETFEDLRRQYQIEYSTVYGSATYRFFDDMANAEHVFYEIWRNLSLDESMSGWEKMKLSVWDYPIDDIYTKMKFAMETAGYCSSTEEALARVRGINQSRQFAFVTETAVIKYLALTNCDLQLVGEEIAKKPYAIGVRKGSPLRDMLNKIIHKLYATRKMDKLKKKWWSENPRRVACKQDLGADGGIAMDYMGAVFLLIILGITCTLLILCFQYSWYFYFSPKIRARKRANGAVTRKVM